MLPPANSEGFVFESDNLGFIIDFWQTKNILYQIIEIAEALKRELTETS